jgi:hypothetical protein
MVALRVTNSVFPNIAPIGVWCKFEIECHEFNSNFLFH